MTDGCRNGSDGEGNGSLLIPSVTRLPLSRASPAKPHPANGLTKKDRDAKLCEL